MEMVVFKLSDEESELFHGSSVAFEWSCLFSFLQLVQEEAAGSSLLQSLGLSLHSRERLIQVGEVESVAAARAAAAEAPTRKLSGMLFFCEAAVRLKWQCQICVFTSDRRKLSSRLPVFVATCHVDD